MRLTLVLLLMVGLVVFQATAAQEIDPDYDPVRKKSMSNRSDLVGKWYLDQPTTKRWRSRVLLTLNVNGTYIAEFQKVRKERVINEYTAVGFWGVEGDILFTITRGRVKNQREALYNPKWPWNYHVYRIIELDDSTFTYESMFAENRFQARKVPKDFEIPPER